MTRTYVQTSVLLVTTSVLLVTLLFGNACTQSPEARRDAHLEKGKQLLAKNDYARAVLEFRNASQAIPNDPEPYYQFAVASLGMRDFGPAVRSLRKALDLDPNHQGAQLKLAQLMASTRDPQLLKEAEAQLRKLAERSASVDTLASLAFTQLKLGSIEEGVQHLNQVLEKAPADLSSSLLLAKAKLWQNDPNGAEQVLLKATTEAPASADAQVLLANFYAGRNRLADAEGRVWMALKRDPANAAALMLLGRLQVAAGKKAEAEQTFRKMTSMEAYRSVYAVYLFQEGRREDALRELERQANEHPDDRTVRTYLIAVYRNLNRKDDAMRVLRQALEKNSKDGEALLQHAELLLESGNHAEAEQNVNRVLHLRPNSPEARYILARIHRARGATLMYRQELGETLRLNPGLEAVRIELARDLISAGNAQAALDILNAAPADQQRSVALQVQRNWAWWALGNMPEMRKGIDAGLAAGQTPDFLIQDGIWHLRAGNAAAARKSLENALRINPGDLRALRYLSQTYTAMKDARGALQKVKEYAEQQPKSAAVQYFLGTMLMANSDAEGARKAFTQARAISPGMLEADLALIQIDVADQKLDDARKKLEAILAKEGSNVTARMWLANLQLIRGETGASAENYRRIVAANPKHAEALNNLAWTLAESGTNMDEALKYAEKAVELAPGKADFSDTLGWILYKKGIYNTAIRYLEQADKGNVVVKYHLAMAYAKAGDLRRGRSTLEAALKIDPNVQEARLAKAVLDEAR